MLNWISVYIILCAHMWHIRWDKHQFLLLPAVYKSSHSFTSLLTLAIVKLLNCCHSNGWEWYLINVFIMVRIEHLFISLQAIWICFSVNCLLLFLANFLLGCLSFSDFFIYSGLVIHLWKHLLLGYGLSFICFMATFVEENFFLILMC